MEIFNKTVLEKIGRQLKERKETIAVAESVTSGLLQYAFSQIPEAATFFQGGITAYNLAQKYKCLAVEPIHAEAVNSVSKEVAEEMAVGVMQLFHSHWGIGITGYASPVPEAGGKLFAWFAIAYMGKVRMVRKLVLRKGDPPVVQEKYAFAVTEALVEQLVKGRSGRRGGRR
ncbi:CinA family protein [Flavihumibacter petaseus]|uniref:CinA C-terminal domain-containing protein n=1 Tax=Flavihumibacter petaseus NBRC 106054 TaxID=1220578 RepID=A0A0E9N0C8_9BACT|nr:CinA family protein [Flavihumibacter petaseus]GAO43081.1 hypothetical protein FPE01S_02_01850 [Flavihumibacter petaseus NBRC 106054]